MAEMIVVATLAPEGGDAGGLVMEISGPPPLPSVPQPERASSAETSATRIFMPTTSFLERGYAGGRVIGGVRTSYY